MPILRGIWEGLREKGPSGLIEGKLIFQDLTLYAPITYLPFYTYREDIWFCTTAHVVSYDTGDNYGALYFNGGTGKKNIL